MAGTVGDVRNLGGFRSCDEILALPRRDRDRWPKSVVVGDGNRYPNTCINL